MSYIDGLSLRAANTLERIGVYEKKQVRKMIQSGALAPNKSGSRKVYNYGWVTHKELFRWVQLPIPAQHLTIQICPHCGKEIHKRIMRERA